MERQERQERYIILKLSDARKYMTGHDWDNLQKIRNAIVAGRIKEGKKDLVAVVVESDWPEYEQVWKMIEDRVNNAPSRLAELKRKADLFDKLRDLMGYVQNGTDTSVTLFQDDATQWFTVAIGRSHDRKGESAPGLEQAINKMHHKYGGE